MVWYNRNHVSEGHRGVVVHLLRRNSRERDSWEPSRLYLACLLPILTALMW